MDLYECKREMRSIISEMRSIAAGISRDFENIGQEKAAYCVDRVANKYEYLVLPKIDKLDYN